MDPGVVQLVFLWMGVVGWGVGGRHLIPQATDKVSFFTFRPQEVEQGCMS